mmetsp:Transcript_25600/g.55073  ORF Transcript_25600/g.55073 Transcript_25600/m.55073 type:complete len:296 (+) Transcript_25600:111-998(+)|eukprot:CAMPEP_0172303022 /NCGR_PEP_ID=MMETSP1058-20130122/4624_1 /TAXON_ID=83371 /ORGANISM="Detonula confervacea, Strain CCMP 353" /LENGTH=295 /DNA_ID=CAMNT_0013013701 /DNA_START=68 /DNA_END=955 /DNA_ORIENTATION=-
MNVYLPLLLFSSVANAELDLYVREKFENAAGDKCGSCSEGGECFLSSRSVFLQQSCLNRGDIKASVYDEVADGVVCRQDFGESCESEDHIFNAEGEDDCRDSWKLGECTDSEQMTKLESWCKKSNEPEGDYTIPLLTFQEFDSVDDCEQGSTDYLNIHLPDEGGACIPLPFQSNGVYVIGSRKVSCDGSVFDAVRYDSPDCTGDPVKTSFDSTSNECTADADSVYTKVYTNNCVAPTIYCKASLSFSGSEGSSGTENEDGGGGGTSISTSSENAGTSGTPGGLLIVGMALLSWIV